MQWNEKQAQAINIRDKNIMVAAAAGSGKTAVLVERILRLLIDEKTDIDKFLIVTFTNAAASEMKSKIIKAVKEDMTKALEEDDMAKFVFLKKQLNNMNKASISTFHAFAISLIREYFYEIDVNPSFNILDETQGKILQKKAMDDVFEENYTKENNSEFFEFLDCYTNVQNDDELKSNLLQVYGKLMSIPHPFKWLEAKIEDIASIDDYKMSDIFKYAKEYISVQVDKYIEIQTAVLHKCSEVGVNKLAAKILGDIENFAYIKELLENDDMEGVASFIDTFKLNRLVATKDEKESYEAIKDEIKRIRGNAKKVLDNNIKEMFFRESFEEQFEILKTTAKYMYVFSRLLNEFHEKFVEIKNDKKVLDFNDLEHFALQILENEEIARECQEKYKYVFVDEYQDSNLLQESIIKKVSRNNNLFTVGDIKQSIYGFRMAEPEIFKNRYNSYKFGEKEQSVCIDLNQNYRSKKDVISSINDVFEKIMEDHDDDAALHPNEAIKDGYNFKPKLKLVENVQFDDDVEMTEIDKLLQEMKEIEVEGYAMAKEIKQLIGMEYYDHKEDIVKNISYKDITILLRQGKTMPAKYKEVLEKNGIPVFTKVNQGYFDTVEVRLMLDLLRVIDNFKQDIPLLGVLYSSVFGFTIDEIIEIRGFDKTVSFHEAFEQVTKDSENDLLREKCNNVYIQLRRWKEQSRYMKLEEFVWKVMQESGIYMQAATMQHGKQRQLNLRTFIDKTANYASMGNNSIYGLLRYFENIKDTVDVGQESLVTEDDDTVIITTIHKSKGLEYPVVILGGLNKKLQSSKKEKIMFDKDFGIALRYMDYKNHYKKTTILQNILAIRQQEKERKEEIRVLYVAMTRAKNQLIMLGSVKNTQEYLDKINTSGYNPNCYMDYILPNVDRNITDVSFVPSTSLTDTIDDEGESNNKKENLREFIKKAKEVEPISKNQAKYDELTSLINFTYPYQREINTKSAYAVSEINHKEAYGKLNALRSFDNDIKVDGNGDVIRTNIDNGDISGVHKGNIYHIIMEQIDFAKALEGGSKYIMETIQRLVSEEFLSQEEADIVDVDKIHDFFKSDVGKLAAQSKHYKEKPFTMLYDKDGVNTVIHGIIDCYFETAEGIVLIDYKTNYYTNNIEKLYKTQLSLYKEAIQKATGKDVVETYLYLFEKSKMLKMTSI